jgi:drug/metabolite transporter (DMT)-like permease
MPEKRALTVVYFKMLAAVVIWGGSFIATKIGLREISVWTLIWLRFALGSLILGAVLVQRGEMRVPGGRDLLRYAFLGLMGFALHQWLQVTGMLTAAASTTAWIVSTAPVFIALLGVLFLKERLSALAAGGIGLATLGVLLVVSKGDLGSVLRGTFGTYGDFLILLSAPNWAIYSVYSRDVLRERSATLVTFWVLLMGWLFVFPPFLLGQGWLELGAVSAQGWLAVLFLGVLCTAAAHLFWNDGLQALGASRSGAFLYLEPLVSLLAAAVLLGETITVFSLLGGGLILLGVWLVNARSND